MHRPRRNLLRAVVAHDIAARMRYGGLSLPSAVKAALLAVNRMGATGGVIAVNGRGRIVVSFNSYGMYRAYVSSDQRSAVAIY